MSEKKVLIIGAGLVGSLLGIYMAKRGHQVKIFERRADMRREIVQAGRSINLALSDRGIKALQGVGIADEVLQIAIPMPGRMIHHVDESQVFQPYGKEGQAIYSVSRGELNRKLMDLAEAHHVEIIFDRKCASINWAKNEVVFDDPTTLNQEVENPDLIFGADGAYSAARLQHMMAHPMFNYQQYYIDCGYKELSIPAGNNGDFLLDKNALHIWPRKDYMLIALPNIEGSFTGTLFFPFKGETSFEKLDTKEKVAAFFNKDFPDIMKIIPNVPEQFFNNPTSSLVTVKCFPWVRDDRFTLIGDAAHAIVPFFGQGMNAAFEDCTVLNELMDKHGDDWKNLLQEFQDLRKPDADAIADLAVNNFIEMRERTADPMFLLQKKIEARLHERHPDKWIPAYSQVTFSPHIRYSEALLQGQKQEAIMKSIMQSDDIEGKWESEEVERMILNQL